MKSIPNNMTLRELADKRNIQAQRTKLFLDVIRAELKHCFCDYFMNDEISLFTYSGAGIIGCVGGMDYYLDCEHIYRQVKSNNKDGKLKIPYMEKFYDDFFEWGIIKPYSNDDRYYCLKDKDTRTYKECFCISNALINVDFEELEAV